MFYILTLCVLIVLFVGILLWMPKWGNKKAIHLTLCILTFSLYIAHVCYVYFDAGATDWNFLNTLPTANVSPFVFCTALLYLIPSKTLRKYHLTLLSLLTVGMLLSPVCNCVHNAIIHYKFHPHFLLDYCAHLCVAVWGVYAVRSKQIELKRKDALISGGFLVLVAVVMLIINLFFDTAFFGLALNEKHNIYNMVLVENAYLSALLYFLGLVAVMAAGFFFQKLFTLKKGKKTEEEKTS